MPLTNKGEKAIADLFKILDDNQSGEIDEAEQDTANKKIHSGLPPSLRWTWSDMDKDGDGKVSESEFLEGMQAISDKVGEGQLLDCIRRTWTDHPLALGEAACWQTSHTNLWPRTWKDLPTDESAVLEAAWNEGRGRSRTKTARSYYNFRYWTATPPGNRHDISALRRLESESSRVVTHPPPSSSPGDARPYKQMIDEDGNLSDIHPCDLYTMSRKEPDDWLSNDFFCSVFLTALQNVGVDTSEYEQPGKMHEWFDFRWNSDYRAQTDAQTHTRGGFPYIEPNGFMGYAVNVLGKYDGGNNDWMKLTGKEGEWAVAYHGTGVEGFPKILQSHGFIVGSAQAYASDKCVKTGVKIGRGVYCTPGLGTAEAYARQGRSGSGTTDFDGHKIIFVFQCRVNPPKIKHCHDYATTPDAYWVLNDPADIRPYRVLIKSV